MLGRFWESEWNSYQVQLAVDNIVAGMVSWVLGALATKKQEVSIWNALIDTTKHPHRCIHQPRNYRAIC